MLNLNLLLSLLSISISSSALASQVSQLEISGLSSSQSLRMIDQKFEPIYETQPYQATCNRQVLDHMETVCSTMNDTVCRGMDREVCETVSDQVCNSHGCTTIPRRVCHQERRVCEVIPRRVCSDHAVMRTEYYSCTQYRTVVVGQRLVKTFDHLVEVSVDRPDLLQNQKLVLSLLARESSVQATLVSSFASHLLTVESQVVANQDSGSVQTLRTKILVHVEASSEVLSRILSASIDELSLSSSGLNLKLNGMNELSQNLLIDLNLTQHRAIISDKTLFRGTLSSSDVLMTGALDSVRISIPLSKLGIEQLKSKRHNLSVSISLAKPRLSILNGNDMSSILNKRVEASISNVMP